MWILQIFLLSLFLLCGTFAGAAEFPRFESDQQADLWLRGHSAFYLRMAETVDQRGGYEFVSTTAQKGGLAYTRQGRGYIELNEALKGAHRISILIFEVTNLYQENRHQEVTQRLRSGEIKSSIEFGLLREMIEYDGLRMHREVLLELQRHLKVIPSEMITWISSTAQTFADYQIPLAYDYIKAQMAGGHTAHFLKLFEKHCEEFNDALRQEGESRKTQIQGMSPVAERHVDEPGFSKMELMVDGVMREALIYVPVAAKTNATPLVFVFHGHGGSSRNAIRSFAMNRYWPEAISVYMQGLNTPGRLTDPEGRKSGWQSGPGDQKDRDIKFFDAVLAMLKQDFKVDEKRIYATGHSNGGQFSYLLWAMRGEIFAAIAPSGAVGTFFNKLKPKPALHIAGEKDPLVRFEWQKKMMETLRKINDCEADGREWARNCLLYQSAKGTPLVTFIYAGGHKFPEEAPPLIVRFFKEHPVVVPDISLIPMDLTVPEVMHDAPVPGKRVLQALPSYKDTFIRHTLYLPADWERGKSYPVIMEYAGNGRTVLGGQSCLGYGISGGKGFIWATLPYVGKDHQSETNTWWGDLNATVSYCKDAVRLICREWGGDPNKVFIAGFSRGAIACNVIGLHDDEIAGLWKGFVCHSHYDDGRWSGTDAAGASERIKRLGRKPQFISNEVPVVEKEKIEQYLQRLHPEGQFTFITLPFTNHTETWVLRDIKERAVLRDWVYKLLK